MTPTALRGAIGSLDREPFVYDVVAQNGETGQPIELEVKTHWSPDWLARLDEDGGDGLKSVATAAAAQATVASNPRDADHRTPFGPISAELRKPGRRK